MQGYWSITELDVPRPPTIRFLRARSSEISGVLELAQHPPHPVPADSLIRPRALLQRVWERHQSNLPTIGFCDQPTRHRARVELQPNIIDQCTWNRDPTTLWMLDA